MKGPEVFRVGNQQMRIGPWRSDEHLAFIAPLAGTTPLTTIAVAECTGHLRSIGYDRIVTTAIHERDLQPFVDNGYEVREHLHLLSHNLRGGVPEPKVATRRARRKDRTAILQLDHLAFDDFWRLDDAGLEEALTATPSSRFRVTGDDLANGYAIFGRAGTRGYLQRLAVHPDAAGTGAGTSLVVDGLMWLYRRGVQSCLVNTQYKNDRAMALYQRLGFEPQSEGLVVLETRPEGQ